MASVNKFIGIGNLGRDPETKYMTSGDAVTNFSIACNETWKDKDGEKQEKTEWVRCVAFKRVAEIIAEYCKKGDPVYVEGRLQTREYEKEGQKHYATEVVVDRFQFLKSRDDDRAAAERTTDRAGRPKSEVKAKNVDEFDSDIPF